MDQLYLGILDLPKFGKELFQLLLRGFNRKITHKNCLWKIVTLLLFFQWLLHRLLLHLFRLGLLTYLFRLLLQLLLLCLVLSKLILSDCII
jgi:hypothetical protein